MIVAETFINTRPNSGDANVRTAVNMSVFNGEGYSNWKRRMRATMVAKELDTYLDPEPHAEDNAEQIKARKAYAILIQFIADGVLSTLQTETTAATIWQKLSDLYDQSGKRTVSQILTRKRLMTVNKIRYVNMREHLDHILKLVSDLRSTGATVSDKDVMVYILMSLPKEYESTRTALKNQQTGLLGMSVAYMRGRLIDAEALMHKNQGGTTRHANPDAWEILQPLRPQGNHSFATSARRRDTPHVSAVIKVCTSIAAREDTSKGILKEQNAGDQSTQRFISGDFHGRRNQRGPFYHRLWCDPSHVLTQRLVIELSSPHRNNIF
ncbi:hypothetical protein JTE90_015204 [Oedothorax gibbosus]|uniref:Retrovirus-related Pol polyprotein from transposon TNT 1-94 n=1 Tax=Oedothorax gibbosus TaxID=931172 RepID=A0AAV6V745_9ARAC|nr:hypothetical protein JTE90_015204 [Oedothorax gibbosus]